MPPEEPATSDPETTIQEAAAEEPAAAGVAAHDVPTRETATPAPDAGALGGYEPFAQDDEQEWDEPIDELPPRPRRRLFGAGGNPVVVALLGVLLIACGFIGGVLVEKGQGSSSSSAGAGAAGLASRFAALRTGGSGAGSASTSGSPSLEHGLRPPDRRHRGVPRREHAVRDQRGRQHRQGDHLGGHERDKDRQGQRQGHPPRRNGHRHRRRRCKRRRQR